MTKNNLLHYIKSQDSSCWFTTGFTDAEGCFYISITKNTKFKTGWKVLAFFEIHIHKKDVELLKFIQNQFKGIGRIVPNGENAYSFRVNSINDLIDTIIPHFDKYPLISQKYADYVLWKQAIIMMKEGKHLTNQGIKEIVNIRASINTGLSGVLKQEFSQAIPAVRLINTPIIAHEAWLSGFTAQARRGIFFNKNRKV
uniref:LAGLIDADG endonuclease n=1 Tax=Cordyceps cicadae TaxID=218633 RepID=A0A481S1G5_9HYPO|nr:LAGLIDADG endonuclease [Cordyceps cicadae]QBG64861.1 LAGLIDADG endonuclease [Cordyceps cicadae]